MRITKKNLQGEEMPHELFVTTKMKTKKINTFAKYMSKDIDVSKAQKLFSKMIRLGGFLFGMLGSLGNSAKIATADVAVLLAKNALNNLNVFWCFEIASNAISNVIYQLETNKWERSRSSRKKIHFVHSKWRFGDIIKIVESLEKSCLLIYGELKQ